MRSITISGIDDETAAKLDSLPDAERSSIEESLRRLARDLIGRAGRRADRRAIAERIAAMTPKGVAQTDGAILIREDRDR